jgi:TPR repeat protein
MEESEKVVYNDSRLEWYIKMATNGNRYAIYELANCYFKGIGTKKDVASGLKWISLLQKEPYQDSVVLYNNYQAEKGNVYVSR